MNLDDQVKAIRSTISMLDTGKPVVCYVGHHSVDEALKLKKMVLIVSYEPAFNSVNTFNFNTIAGSYRYVVPVPLAEVAGFSEMLAEIEQEHRREIRELDNHFLERHKHIMAQHEMLLKAIAAHNPPFAAACMKCGIELVRNGWIGCNSQMEQDDEN